MKFKLVILAAIACLCAPFSLKAQKEIPAESDATGAKILQTAQFKDFIGQYIAAVNAKDRKALRALYDPVSQAAMAKDEKEVVEILDAAVDEKIPAKHEIVVSMIGPNEPLMLEDQGAVYAVRPIALVQINFSTGSTATSETMLFIATSGGKWYEVWSNPPDEKKMEAAMQKVEDDERQQEKAVKTSGVTNYKYEPNSKDAFTKLYNWEVRLTAADSKKDKYEIVQIDRLAGGAAKTTVLVGKPSSGGAKWMDSLRPSDDGYVGFKLGIGDKAATLATLATNRVLWVPLQFVGFANGMSRTDSIFLSGTVLGAVVPADKGAALVDGTLQLIRFNTTDAKGGTFVTDIVLRPVAKMPVGGGKVASGCSWAPSECSNPMVLPAGYHGVAEGQGKYRVMRDGEESSGSIAIIFQAQGTLDPKTVAGAREAPLKIKGQQLTWRRYETEADGKPIIRKEFIMPNILPRTKTGNQADYIWVRVDAPTQQVINALSPLAHGIIRDSL
jgi:hypothetical protein